MSHPRLTFRIKRNPLRARAQSTAFPFILPYRYSSGPLPFALPLLSPSPPPLSPGFLFLRRCCSPRSLFSRSPDRRRIRRSLLSQDHGEHALARPASFVARLVLHSVATNVETPAWTLEEIKKTGRHDECSVVDVTLVDLIFSFFFFQIIQATAHIK